MTGRKVHDMADGEILVRGTTDPATALGWVVGDLDTEDWHPDNPDLDGVAPGQPVDPERVSEVRELLTSLLSRAQVGRFRIVHCLPNSMGAAEGWSWQLGYAARDTPARGAFPGVYFPR